MSEKVTRRELIDSVIGIGLRRADAKRAVDSWIETIRTEVARGATVAFVGFGKFHMSRRRRRRFYLPSTGGLRDVAAREILRFTPSRTLKESVMAGAPVSHDGK